MIYALVMLTMFSKHLSSLMISLRYFYEILSSPGADELLYLLMAVINFSLKKRVYIEYGLERSSFHKNMFTHQLWAELNVWYRAFQRSSISIHSYLLYWIASIFLFFDPIHKILWSMVFWYDSLNLVIKK